MSVRGPPPPERFNSASARATRRVPSLRLSITSTLCASVHRSAIEAPARCTTVSTPRSFSVSIDPEAGSQRMSPSRPLRPKRRPDRAARTPVELLPHDPGGGTVWTDPGNTSDLNVTRKVEGAISVSRGEEPGPLQVDGCALGEGGPQPFTAKPVLTGAGLAAWRSARGLTQRIVRGHPHRPARPPLRDHLDQRGVLPAPGSEGAPPPRGAP